MSRRNALDLELLARPNTILLAQRSRQYDPAV
jgi:hypothetical protein